jgi:hypothetical protein
MPRRRSQTQLAVQEQPTPDYSEFRDQVNTWFQDLFLDTNSKTGYLVKEPQGFYGSRLKQLIRYVYQQSNEVKAIQTNQQIRASSICIYLFHVVRFLSEYILPAVFAMAAAYLYYYSAESVFTTSPLIQVIPINKTNNITLYSIAQGAGTFIGDFARELLSVPVSFATSTVDRVLHVQEGLDFFQSHGHKLLYTPLIAFGVYFGSFLLLRFLLNLQQLISKQTTLWAAQGLFLQETQETIERAVTGIVKPFLIKSYEGLLHQTSEDQKTSPKTRALVQSIYLTYNNDLDMLRETLFEKAEAHVKAIPFSELLVQGQVSKQYLNGLYRLIRDSDQQLATVLFDLNQELGRIPSDSRRLLTN